MKPVSRTRCCASQYLQGRGSWKSVKPSPGAQQCQSVLNSSFPGAQSKAVSFTYTYKPRPAETLSMAHILTISHNSAGKPILRLLVIPAGQGISIPGAFISCLEAIWSWPSFLETNNALETQFFIKLQSSPGWLHHLTLCSGLSYPLLARPTQHTYMMSLLRTSCHSL